VKGGYFVRVSYRNILWIIVFGVFLAVAEYTLAIQSARLGLTSDPEFGAKPNPAGSASGVDGGGIQILR
jgi:hypothetical protein